MELQGTVPYFETGDITGAILKRGLVTVSAATTAFVISFFAAGSLLQEAVNKAITEMITAKHE